jgi:uncharacterized membrane protein YphA (DoxX/SURF4 family)
LQLIAIKRASHRSPFHEEGTAISKLTDFCSHLFPSLPRTWQAIPLRLIVGYGITEHGSAKLARGPDDFAHILHALGLPAAMLWSWATILVELLGGFAVFVGAFIPLACVPMATVLLVAIFTVHVPDGFSSIKLQSERIHEFNSSATGFFNGEGFTTTVRDASGRIIAGVSGHTRGECCQISQLWVHEFAKEHGVGKSLMLAVEAHALCKNCTQIVLSSHDFQAPDFYRKLGFIEQTRISGYPRGHSNIHFTKFLGGGNGVL